MPATEKQSEVQFDETTHTYTVDGRVVPSVTQVLRAAGFVDDRWFNEKARNRGRKVAIAIDLLNEGNLWNCPDDIRGYVDAWEQFLADGFVPREVEKPRYHALYDYAGTPDALGLWLDRPTVVDAKTGLERPEYKLQTAGYAGLLDVYHDRLCLFLCDDGTYRIRQHNEIGDCDYFLAALKVTHWQRANLK